VRKTGRTKDGKFLARVVSDFKVLLFWENFPEICNHGEVNGAKVPSYFLNKNVIIMDVRKT